MCGGPAGRERLLPGEAAPAWGSGPGTPREGRKAGVLGLEGESGDDLMIRVVNLLMRVHSPVGRQRGAPGLRAEPPLVPGRGHQLGRGLWPEKQTWRVHQSDGSPPLDIQQDGGESPAGCVHPAGGDSQRWGAWKRA